MSLHPKGSPTTLLSSILSRRSFQVRLAYRARWLPVSPGRRGHDGIDQALDHNPEFIGDATADRLCAGEISGGESPELHGSVGLFPPSPSMRRAPVRSHWAAHLLLRFPKPRRFNQSKEHDFLAGDGADVVVHAHDLDAGDFVNHRFQQRSRGFEKMCTNLFEEVSPLFGRQRLDQVLFGGCQDALEADKENVVDQVRGCPWAPGPCIPAQSD